MILLSQPANQFTRHDKRLFVGQTHLFVRLDGLNGWRKTSESNQCRKHHVYRFGLYDFIKRRLSRINLHLRTVIQQPTERFIHTFIGDNHRSWLELSGLRSQFFIPVVGGEAIGFIQVSMLLDDIECLCTDAAC